MLDNFWARKASQIKIASYQDPDCLCRFIDLTILVEGKLLNEGV